MNKTQLKQTINNMWSAVSLFGNSNLSLILNEASIMVEGNGCQCWMHADLPLSSSIQISGEAVLKILNAAPNEELQLNQTETTLSFRSGKFKASVAIIDQKEIPDTFITNDSFSSVDISEEAWTAYTKAVQFTLNAASTNNPEFACIYQDSNGIWACNRISMIHLKKPIQKNTELMLPRAAIQAIQKIDKQPSHVNVNTDSLIFVFDQSAEGGEIECALSAQPEDFPIKEILNIFDNKSKKSKWTCKKKDLEEAVQSVGTLSESVQLIFQEKRLIIKATDKILSQYQVMGKLAGDSPDSYSIMTEEIKRIVSFSSQDEITWEIDNDRGHLFAYGEDYEISMALSPIEEKE